MHYFDFNSKSWKPLTSLAPPADTTFVYCAEAVGSKIFVAGSIKDNCNGYIYWYDLEKNIWEKHSQSNGELSHLCTVGDYMYAFNSDCTQIPQRYSFSERQWQSFAKVTVPRGVIFFNSGTAVLHSKVFISSSTNFQLIVVLESHQGRCILFPSVGKTGEHFLDSCPLLFAIKEKEPKHNLREDKDIFMLKLLLFFFISCYRNPTQLELTKQKNPGDYSHYSQLN